MHDYELYYIGKINFYSYEVYKLQLIHCVLNVIYTHVVLKKKEFCYKKIDILILCH